MFDPNEIKSEKCISLETYRKNDQPVKTPVWFVVKDNLIYVITRSRTGKVKRLQNNFKVKFATCTARGKVTGKWISGSVKILSDEETREISKMRDRKYGFMAKIAKFFSKTKGELYGFSIKAN